ncbi:MULTISPECIES: hypothetical protein [unclassified Clostridioides]|uniref:hypothetical protein n=1 Tax=unclassified Clostridioides TaxID=2635829 RepID=UPI001D10A8E4|nr:hypothetical protein [Clostridioides sp. ES-S-0049-03]MCC0677295.1 hypothetical protein [Clostridioides sp. ES-W-0018-02]MCC0712444.1 hypothetical protein [Clostridioides sp. ES-W-0017-02]
MARRHISAVISLKDNMSATMRGIRREQTQFQREVRRTRNEMRAASRERMRIRMDATPANRVMQNLNQKLAPLRTKLVKIVAIKDLASEKVERIKSNVKAFGRFIARPAIKLKDETKGMIDKIKNRLTSLSTIVPIGMAAGAAAATVKSGMELEQQQISMRHFMGVGNKGKSSKELDGMSASYLKELRGNANATPFETGEVISAGTRSLQIAGGNTKNAMQMVKLAEDMAALNPGKTVGDAMEALADMNIGEMARLTEFGVKASSTDDPKDVQKKLETMYAGGAGKLAESGSGLLSTIMGKLKSNVADIGLGMLEPLKPVMSGLIGFIDQASPKILEVGTKITSGIGTAIGWFQQQMPTLAPIFQTAFSAISSIVSTVAPIIGQVISALAPIFMGLLSVASSVLSGIASAVKTVAPIVSSLISKFSPVFSNVGSTLKSMGKIFKNVFDSVMKVVKKASDYIKPLIDGIAGAANGLSDGFNWVVGKLAGNATGTKYWSGGLSVVGEHGPELVQMPRGSKVFTNSESKSIVNKSIPTLRQKQEGNVNYNISIPKLAETIVIREDADIEKIMSRLITEIQMAKVGGVV